MESHIPWVIELTSADNEQEDNCLPVKPIEVIIERINKASIVIRLLLFGHTASTDAAVAVSPIIDVVIIQEPIPWLSTTHSRKSE